MKKNNFSYPLSLLLLFSMLFYCNNLFSNTIINEYRADIDRGVIGKKADQLSDDPRDNVFTIEINNSFKTNAKIWLTYSLYGVQDHSAISRSINDNQSVGGYLVQPNENWSEQRELIHPSWLKTGKNIIRFTIPSDVDYYYEIEDLKIVIEENDILSNSLSPDIIVNQSSKRYYHNKGYAKGFLQGVGYEASTLLVNGVTQKQTQGEFEVLVDKPQTSEASWSVLLQAIFPDGKQITKKISFDESVEDAYLNDFSLEDKYISILKNASSVSETRLNLQGASISIPPFSLVNETAVSITALRPIDISAMNTDLVNVTKGKGGYRFLPHGTQFQKKISIGVEFDPMLIPAGYTQEDIRTFYFDEEAKRWIKIELDSINKEANQIISNTNHFTDFISGIIKVPESPETQGYKSTSIKDIKAADPSAGIVSINPPIANNMGTANLNFPIKIPQGRQGMQPQLTITYNSEGGNGWLGLGWNLSIPSISIDTRWGAPRFNQDLETETYSFEGQMLFPVAHRDELEPRTPEKIFNPRVESAFDSIIRHGNLPNNYWWEVISKEGIRTFYGGLPGEGVIENAVLRDSENNTGNISYWSVLEKRDLNGNSITYHCSIQEDFGLETGGAVMGKQLYIDSIRYTNHINSIGKYTVHFIRDRNINSTDPRKDVQISGRLGFKQVTAHLLKRIEVKFRGAMVRSYDLEYIEGTFYKTLLDVLIEYDQEGIEFYRHSFEYYDDFGDADKPFQNSMVWEVDNDIQGDLVFELPALGIVENLSLLSGSTSENSGFGAAVTVGLLGNLASKIGTIGGSFSISKSESNGKVSLVDIDGDGLPDKIYRDASGLKFRKNLFRTQGESFGIDNLIDPSLEFSLTNTKSRTFGLEAHPANTLMAGYNNTKSKSDTRSFLTDFNGDGLIDIAGNGKVYFNKIGANNLPEYVTNVSQTESIIFPGSEIDVSVLMPTQAEIDELVIENPLHDVVRVWFAPYAGTINISGDIDISYTNEPGLTGGEDGVHCRIQYNEDANYFLDEIILGDDSFPYNTGAITVNKGDRIYFRVQSIENGAFDKIKWDPLIVYQEYSGLVDANNKSCSEFLASDDYTLESCQSIILPFTGHMEVDGFFSKPITSDSLIADILLNGTSIKNWEMDWPTLIDEMELSESLLVQEGDELLFRVSSTTNVDWSEIKWNPRIYYVDTLDQQTGSYPSAILEYEREGQTIKDTVFSFCPAPEFQMYNNVILKTPVQNTNNTGIANGTTVLVTENLSFVPPNNINSKFTLSVKKVNEFIGEQFFSLVNGVITSNSPQISFEWESNVDYYFEYHFENNEILNAFGMTPSASVLVNSSILPAGAFTKVPGEQEVFGPLYRGWGQFAYNGNLNRANEPIHENELNLDFDASNVPSSNDFPNDPDQFDPDSPDPTSSNFILLILDMKKESWIGQDEFTFVTADSISSSRLGEDDVSGLINLADPEVGCIQAPLKITESITNSFSVSLGIGGSWSETDTNTKMDAMDFNGDRYPDVILKNAVQYTNARGGLEAIPTDHNLGEHLARSQAVSLSLGGKFVDAKVNNSKSTTQSSSAKAQVRNTNENGNTNSSDANKTSVASVSLNGSLSCNGDNAKESWIDINGDGLPDKVQKGGMVKLNLGYRFTSDWEQWNFVDIRKGISGDIGGGAGVSINNGSISGGVGMTLTNNETLEGLQDVNGDGLLDLIELDCASDLEDIINTDLPDLLSILNSCISVSLPDLSCEVMVSINSGNGFQAPVGWEEYLAIDEGKSVGQSINGAFTVCIPIPILGIKICVNPSANAGNGISRQINQLTDINGDGFPDYLESDNDDNLSVKLSTIGRTNMLKKVHRPMASNFELGYNLVGNTYEMPFGKWVLDTVSIFDGYRGDGADTMKYCMEYENGFQERHERDFYGFERVISHQLDTENQDAIYRSTVQEYHNDNYHLKGLLKREYLQDGNANKFTETINEYELKDIVSGVTLPLTFDVLADGAAFPALIKTSELFYEGQPTTGLTTYTEYEYDNIGNVVEYTDVGEGTTEDLLEATITYYDTGLIRSSPSSIEVRSAGNRIRYRESDIDPRGNVTEIRQFLSNGESADYSMTYDGFGNLERITRPANINGQRFFYEYSYDDEVQTYVTKIEDAYGYSSESVYDYFFGALLETTDINNQQIRYEIDAKGRNERITGPFELALGLPYTIEFEYHPEPTNPDTIPYAITRHHDPETLEDILTYTFMDGLQRPIQVKKTGAIFAGNGQPDNIEMIVSGRVFFDAFGRTIEARYPLTEGLGSESTFNPTINPVTPTLTTFDVLDRELTITLPDNSNTSLTYSIEEDISNMLRFRTQVIDALGNNKLSFNDLRGRKKSTRDSLTTEFIWTQFEYNAISELQRVIDDGDNITSYTYDQLGRKTSRDHPDAGVTSYTYDLASNLTSKVTANITKDIPNGGAILYNYEFERLIGIDYPKNFQNKVVYHYGAPNASHNRAGRIWLQEDASGGQEFFYDSLGNVIKNIRTILVDASSVISFVSESEYDTWNRIQTMYYPDGEKVDYTYNRAGKLTSLASEKLGRDYRIVDQLGYDEFEQRVFLKYGNGTVTNYAYEPDRRRLATLDVRTTSGKTFIDNTYGYDVMNNVLSISNAATPPTAPFQLGGSCQQEYEYDELYRLIGASGNWDSYLKNQNYTLEMSYDNLHNIVSKDQRHVFNDSVVRATTYNYEYTYDPNRPHVPAQIAERAFTYDANGNNTGWTGTNPLTDKASYRQIVWDEEDRIQAIIDDGYLSQYTYDAGGERVLKSHGGVQGIFIDGAPAGMINHRDNYIAYVSPYMVAEKHKFTKHYFIEGQRIASRLGSGQFDNPAYPYGGITAGNLNYTQRIQQLQQAAIEYYVSTGLPPGPPTLPGLYAQPENTGDPIPIGAPAPYNAVPFGWPAPNGPPDVNGPPGPPTWFGPQPTNDNVRAGYGFQGNEVFWEADQYFFHPDHLGNTSYITDLNGELRQHVEYMPFGETFLEEHTSGSNQPYLFNGKELDRETGLYYYGARYYNPKTSIWQSVDPMSDEYEGWSPYNYTLQNPIVYKDPDGEIVESLWDAVNIGMGVVSLGKNLATGNFAGAALDAVGVVADGAALLVPGVPGGAGTAIKAGRAAKKVVDIVDNTVKAEKVVSGAKTVKNVVNGNSKASKKAQHLYEVFDQSTGEVVKTGISGGKITKKGKSYRANKQVNKWNKAEGKDKYNSRIVDKEPAGPGARQRILNKERKNASKLQKEGHLKDPQKHVRPRDN